MWLIALPLVSIILTHHLCVCQSVCPKSCACDRGGEGLALQCFRLQAVPSGIPTETKRLNLAHNDLREIKGADFSKLTKLEEVMLQSAGLESVDNNAFRPQSRLQLLDLQNNRLRLLPRGLPASLHRLKVGHNRIQALQEVALESLGELRQLDLRGNRIASLRAAVFSPLARLEQLHLDGNQIAAVQGSLPLPQLQLLSLEDNRIASLPASFFAALASLTTLRLTGNMLARVPSGLPPSLAVLALDRNRVRSLRAREMAHLGALRLLTLAHNRLASVDAALRLPQLASLDVAGNLLQVLPGSLGPRLERLDCGQNALREVTVHQLAHMGRLRHLLLENNTLRGLQDDALRNNRLLASLALEQNLLTAVPDGLPDSLVRLDLKGNKISVIHDRQLRPLRRLQVLNLRGNLLTGLPASLGSLLPRLTALLLEGNPWNCTCKLNALARALSVRGVAMPHDKELCGEAADGEAVGEAVGGKVGGQWRAYLAMDRCEDDDDDDEDYADNDYEEDVIPEEQQDMDIVDYEDYDYDDE